jgi:iron(III) transport system ATP-binding protein
MPPPAIELIGVHRHFGAVTAVDGLDLEVATGAIVALLGPSGCGKTTALRVIAGFERPDAGTVDIAGRRVAGKGVDIAPERRRVGMVFQDYALFPHLDVAGNAGYALGRRPDPARIEAVLELVGLTDAAHRRPHELSGGQQQRVALARALAPRPEVVLLDEPFSNLDASLRVRVRADVREILREAGVSALLVTHDQDEALSLADHVAVMRAGRIEQAGSPDEVYERPANRWIAEFLGEVDVLTGVADGQVATTSVGTVPAGGLAGQVDVLVRPESVAVGVHRPSREHGRRGVIIAREYFGHDQLLVIDLGDGITLRSRRPGFPGWHPGDRVTAWLEGPTTVLPRDGTSG